MHAEDGKQNHCSANFSAFRRKNIKKKKTKGERERQNPLARSKKRERERKEKNVQIKQKINEMIE